MSEARHRSEVVSTRLSPEEATAIRKLAGERGISTYLRERALAEVEKPAPPCGNPHAKYVRGEAWELEYAPGRIIQMRRGPRYFGGSGIGVWTPRDARDLAAALLEAANVAEQPDPTDQNPAEEVA